MALLAVQVHATRLGLKLEGLSRPNSRPRIPPRFRPICAMGVWPRLVHQSVEESEVWTVARMSLAAAALSVFVSLSLPALAADPPLVLDAARVLTPGKARELEASLRTLEEQTGWKVRVATRTEPTASTSGAALRALFSPDDRTVVVVEDITSPNVLTFFAGPAVPLPRGFFLELQSRFGNQFFVGQEGVARALLATTEALEECLTRPEGCRSVPGLTDDLYFLTLATSITAGCVVGFAARIPPSGRIGASWQWVLLFAPLWLLLAGAFGVLPIISRTSELEPLLKNLAGFLAGALALYWTPILGPSPTSNSRDSGVP